MAFQTLPKQFFIYNLLERNKDKQEVFTVPVRLKLMWKTHKLYVNEIIVNPSKMEIALNGDDFGQLVLNLLKLPSELTYEFNY